MSLCRPCKRCRIPRGVLRTTAVVGEVVEHVWLCNPCRSDAAWENSKALWRVTRGLRWD